MTIESWATIQDEFRSGVLIGNGTSLAVSQSFWYESLLDVAGGTEIEHPLLEQDRTLFQSTNESDFEAVLGSLSKAVDLAATVGADAGPFEKTYERVRTALIEAVHFVHPRHGDLDGKRFEALQGSLAHFDNVFTTNYDLLLYWALTSTPHLDDFRDYFWGPQLDFDLADTWVAANKTVIHYLHGGLHLFQIPDGSTVKASGASQNSWTSYVPLLELTFDYRGARYPLFVSEGSSDRKMAAINSNSYLAFCYEKWVEQQWKAGNSLVVFGHRLGLQDDHLLKPLRAKIAKAREKGWSLPRIAVSVRPASDNLMAASIEHYRQRTGHDDLTFFDSTTHPLGA